MTHFHFDRRRFLAGTATVAATVAETVASRDLHGCAPQDQPVLDPHSDQFSPDTLFLTWQRDPTTTMTIQWLGRETDADQAIRYSTLAETESASAATITKPYVNTDLKVFRCELSGLLPGTEYKFQIGKSFPSYRFRTMPSKVTDEFRFVSGGDSGIDEHAIATNRLAALQNPNFVLMAGDLAYDNGTAPDVFTRYLRNYAAAMYDAEHRLIPMITCIMTVHSLQGENRYHIAITDEGRVADVYGTYQKRPSRRG